MRPLRRPHPLHRPLYRNVHARPRVPALRNQLFGDSGAEDYEGVWDLRDELFERGFC
jgi:hypothetical protein